MLNRLLGKERLWLLAGMILLVLLTIWRLVYVSSIVRSWDEVDFALALERFDLLAMQPHFPGYPYFILGGMFIQMLGVQEPVRALGIFNVLMSALSMIPLYYIGRHRLSPSLSIWLALLIMTPAYLWIISVIPMSEAAAVAILWWYIWSYDRGMRSVVWAQRYVLPLFFFGLLMGIRLSYAPFGIGLLLLFMRDKDLYPTKFKARFLWALLLAAFFQLIWIGGLISTEGSISGFITMTKGFVSGHFEDWGGTVVTSTDPFLWRTLKLVFDNILWTGWFAHSKVLMSVFVALIVILLICSDKRRRELVWDVEVKSSLADKHLVRGVWIMLVLYLLWVLIGQNIDKPRHIVPLIGVGSLLTGIWIIRAFTKQTALLVILSTTIIQCVIGSLWIERQAVEKSAVYQMAEQLDQRVDPFILYTWEETRLLAYMNVKFPYQPVLTYALFREQLHHAQDRKVLLTDHVLYGFEQQAGSLSDKVKLIGEFQSNPLFDPVYAHIRLYEWIDK